MAIQVYAPNSNAEEAENEWFYEDLQEPTPQKNLVELTPKKDVLFIIGDWNAKVGRCTWCNRQIWPWSTTGSRAKPNRVLSREHTDENKHSFPTTQEMILPIDIIRWSIPKSD